MMPGMGPVPGTEKTYEEPDPRQAETAKPEVVVPQGPNPVTGQPQYETAGQTPAGEEIIRQTPQPVPPEEPKPEVQPAMPPVDGGGKIPQGPENPNDNQIPPKPQGIIGRFFGNFFGPKAPKPEAPVQPLDNTQQVPKVEPVATDLPDNNQKSDQPPVNPESGNQQG